MEKEKQIDCKKIIERLCKADWGSVQRPWEGTTILERAIMTDNIEIVKDLLELGVDVNLLNDEGETALFYEKISVKMARFLLEQGLDPKIKTEYEQKAIERHYENDDIVLLLLPVSNIDENDLFLPNLVSELRFSEALEEVLKYVKDINEFDSNGETLLMREARRPNNLDKILVLAKSGIDLQLENQDGKDFYDLCYKNVQKVIRKEFPKFMKNKKIRNDANKYCL